MKELKIEATPENLDTVIAFVDGQLEEFGCGMKQQMAIDLAVEELFYTVIYCRNDRQQINIFYEIY